MRLRILLITGLCLFLGTIMAPGIVHAESFDGLKNIVFTDKAKMDEFRGTMQLTATPAAFSNKVRVFNRPFSFYRGELIEVPLDLSELPRGMYKINVALLDKKGNTLSEDIYSGYMINPDEWWLALWGIMGLMVIMMLLAWRHTPTSVHRFTKPVMVCLVMVAMYMPTQVDHDTRAQFLFTNLLQGDENEKGHERELIATDLQTDEESVQIDFPESVEDEIFEKLAEIEAAEIEAALEESQTLEELLDEDEEPRILEGEWVEEEREEEPEVPMSDFEEALYAAAEQEEAEAEESDDKEEAPEGPEVLLARLVDVDDEGLKACHATFNQLRTKGEYDELMYWIEEVFEEEELVEENEVVEETEDLNEDEVEAGAPIEEEVEPEAPEEIEDLEDIEETLGEDDVTEDEVVEETEELVEPVETEDLNEDEVEAGAPIEEEVEPEEPEEIEDLEDIEETLGEDDVAEDEVVEETEEPVELEETIEEEEGIESEISIEEEDEIVEEAEEPVAPVEIEETIEEVEEEYYRIVTEIKKDGFLQNLFNSVLETGRGGPPSHSNQMEENLRIAQELIDAEIEADEEDSSGEPISELEPETELELESALEPIELDDLDVEDSPLEESVDPEGEDDLGEELLEEDGDFDVEDSLLEESVNSEGTEDAAGGDAGEPTEEDLGEEVLEEDGDLDVEDSPLEESVDSEEEEAEGDDEGEPTEEDSEEDQDEEILEEDGDLDVEDSPLEESVDSEEEEAEGDDEDETIEEDSEEDQEAAPPEWLTSSELLEKFESKEDLIAHIERIMEVPACIDLLEGLREAENKQDYRSKLLAYFKEHFDLSVIENVKDLIEEKKVEITQAKISPLNVTEPEDLMVSDIELSEWVDGEIIYGWEEARIDDKFYQMRFGRKGRDKELIEMDPENPTYLENPESIEIPFTFNVFGHNTSIFYIDQNGYVTWRPKPRFPIFEELKTGYLAPLALLEEDMVFATEISTQIIGEAPKQTAVIEWLIMLQGREEQMKVQLQLIEESQSIKFSYENIPDDIKSHQLFAGIKDDGAKKRRHNTIEVRQNKVVNEEVEVSFKSGAQFRPIDHRGPVLPAAKLRPGYMYRAALQPKLTTFKGKKFYSHSVMYTQYQEGSFYDIDSIYRPNYDKDIHWEDDDISKKFNDEPDGLPWTRLDPVEFWTYPERGRIIISPEDQVIVAELDQIQITDEAVKSNNALIIRTSTFHDQFSPYEIPQKYVTISSGIHDYVGHEAEDGWKYFKIDLSKFERAMRRKKKLQVPMELFVNFLGDSPPTLYNLDIEYVFQ